MNVADAIKENRIKGYLTVNKRIIFENGIYHITQRAPGREKLFVEESDYLYFLRLLKETVKKFDLVLFSFVLLPNHVHFFLKIRQENLSQSMKSLFERYANYFNKKYIRKGHVFCGRYRASLCNDERYFLAISLYIHLNPVRAGLCKDATGYRWSSIGLYGGEAKESFVNSEDILSCLSERPEQAKQIYRSLLKQNLPYDEGSSLDASNMRGAVRKIFSVCRGLLKKEKQGEDLDSLIDTFRSKERLRSVQERQARAYLVEQLLSNGYSRKEIAQRLAIARSTLHRILNETKQV